MLLSSGSRSSRIASTVCAISAPAVCGAQRPGRARACSACRPSSSAAAKSVPPGRLARSMMSAPPGSCCRRARGSTGAGIVLMTASKLGSSVGRAVRGAARHPAQRALARCSGLRDVYLCPHLRYSFGAESQIRNPFSLNDQ